MLMLASLVGGYVVGWDHHKGVYRKKIKQTNKNIIKILTKLVRIQYFKFQCMNIVTSASSIC